MPRMELCKFTFQGGYASDLSITASGGYIRQGSRNFLVTGAGLIVPFKGLTAVVGPECSRQHFLTDDGYAGLGDVDTVGFGSVFKCIDQLFFIGGGPLAVNGLYILDPPDQVLASTQFQFLTRDSGVFDRGDAGFIFDVGHPRPSAPSLYAKTPVSADQKPMNAVVAMVIWRADSNTGQPSLPSESVTVTITNGSVIVQFPAADSNGQDIWGVAGTLLGIQLGNLYQIPTSRGGEVLESTLAYTRTVTGTATNTDETLTLDAGTSLANQFTSADIGRRVARGADLDSWIVSVTDGFNAECNDAATGTSTGNVVITHAVDGYERAIEISWSDDDLLATATLAPFHAFEPPDGRFAGFILDTFFIEDTEGTIFYSLPNYLSFPRLSRKIFTEDRATVYIDTGRGYQWRIAPQSISQLSYFPGEAPIQLSIKAKNIGCQYPTNACLGYGGRLMVWDGRPTIVDNDGSFNSNFHHIVESEFDGWEDQTADEPVVLAYDNLGKYELWCKGSKIMAIHAIAGAWCAPIDITDFIDDDDAVILGSVIVEEKLRLVIKVDGVLKQYKWNDGDGSDTTLMTYFRQLPAETAVTEIQSVVKAGLTELTMVYTIIADFDREILVGEDVVPEDTTSNQCATSFRPNVRGVSMLGIKVTCEGADGRSAMDFIDCFGEWNEAFSNPRDL